ALQDNQARLKQYEWIENMVVSKNGDEKSQKQYRCYYGADGALQKVLIDSSQDEGRERRGLRGRIIAHKKEEMTEYMQRAADLIKRYIPPQSAKIQAAWDAGNVAVKPGGSAKTVELEIQSYLLPGDSLDLNLDMGKPEVTGLQVSSYLDNPKDAVTLAVTFGKLQDGTNYPKQTLLTTKKKDLTIQVQNSGYRKMGS
ncbi:MAG: hypothetical protein K8R69_10365, partial [Deltaproteobacteria bacterium]|nr:hypothetical protein [Deltaproteobacteria bacterium]